VPEPSAPPAPPELPTGTVTFLFTDLEGSTAAQQAHPAAYRAAVRRHHALLQGAVEGHGGAVFETVGDAVYAAFERPTDAVAAALAGQLALGREAWGELGTGALRARMGIHLGEVEAYPAPGAAHGARYLGLPLVRCARLLATAHGGQVVLSEATAALVRDALPAGAALRDLGEHRLKDLQRPERIFQLLHPDLPGEFPPLRSLDALPTNLPAQLTSFVGRERELAEVDRLLAAQRLVTLTGPGGVGKTRLALLAAAAALDAFPGGVWFVGLAPVADPALVPAAVAQALGVRETPGRPLVETLTDALRAKRLLLVLDNCEHLLPAAAPVVAELLAAGPGLKALATSRAPLRVAGEHEHPVPPLGLPPLPDPLHPPSPAALSRHEAVALFVERAAAVRPDFALTAASTPAVAAICRRLDGLPLALELAAARVKLLPPQALLARLDRRLAVLTGAPRDAPARQQTLRATLDWSYALLGPSERTLLARLAVFAGGFSLEAAEAVGAGAAEAAAEGGAAPPLDVLDGLGSLVDHSLLRQEAPPDGAPCFRMLETVREYARERLEQSGEAAAVRRRHAAYFLALAERAAPGLSGPAQGAWLERLEGEHDDLRAALAWAAADEQSGAAGLRLAGALGRFWEARGHFSEGLHWLEQALEASAGAPSGARAAALYAAGVLAGRARQADDPGGAARTRFEQGLALFREAGDQRGVAACLDQLGTLARERGDHGLGRALCEQSLALRRAIGDRWGIATSLIHLAGVLREQGDYGRARELLQESLALRRAIGDRWGIATSLIHLGWLALDEGDDATAGGLLEEGLARSRELGNTGGVATSLNRLAALAEKQGDYARAAALYEESLGLRRALEGARGVASVLHHLGRTALRQGDPGRGAALFRESLSLCLEHRDEAGITRGIVGLAGVAAAAGRAARAARLLGAGAARLDARFAQLFPADRAEYDRSVATTRAQLAEAAFAAAWAEGQAMPREQVVAYALADAPDAT